MNEAETAESTHGHGCTGPSCAPISRRVTPEGKEQDRQTSREKVSQDRHVVSLSIGAMMCHGTGSREGHVQNGNRSESDEMKKAALFALGCSCFEKRELPETGTSGLKRKILVHTSFQLLPWRS